MSFLLWTLFILWFLGVGVGQLSKQTTKVVKKVAENETVQEAGKGVLARWLDSVFKQLWLGKGSPAFPLARGGIDVSRLDKLALPIIVFFLGVVCPFRAWWDLHHPENWIPRLWE